MKKKSAVIDPQAMIQAILETNARMQLTIDHLTASNQKFQETISQLTASNQKLQETVDSLNETVRELEGVTDNHPEQTWSKQFREMLFAMKNDRDKAFAAGETELRYWQLQKYDRQYTEILRTACEENPLLEPMAGKKGRPKRGKVRALIDRLEKYRESVCLFIKNFQVPFDNNQAERDIRMLKVKTKQITG